MLLLLAAPILARLLFATRPADAVPVARYSWDDCAPIVTNKSRGGPGSYVQVFSAVGLMPGMSLVQFGVDTGYVSDAWSFAEPAGSPGCQPASRLAILSAGTSCAAAPVVSFEYHVQLWLTRPDKSGWYVGVHLDPNFAPDPAVRYTLVKLVFDHSHSVVGAAAAGSGDCGSAERAVCFGLGGASYVTGFGQTALALDSDYLTWQDYNANLYPGARPCPAAVAARAATWGAIKVQYR